MSFFLLLNINAILKNVGNQTVAGPVISIVFIFLLSRGRPIIGADIKHFTDIGHFKNRFADNFNFFFYAKKHTIYR